MPSQFKQLSFSSHSALDGRTGVLHGDRVMLRESEDKLFLLSAVTVSLEFM